jgi:hypothetical protein
MSLCIVYLASPTDFLIHPQTDKRRRYEALKYSMTSVRKLFPKTPIYVFHEDYTEEDKQGLNYTTATFVQVDFTGFESVYRNIHASLGYMMMCRFFSGILQSHPALQTHTHYIRFDDDSYLTPPFLTEERAKLFLNCDYVYRSVFREAKPQQSLYEFTLQFLRSTAATNVISERLLIQRLQREGIVIGNRYTGKAPYNNFHCASLRLWSHPLVSRYIQAIESVHGILHHGWLDANIHAMVVWVLAPLLSLEVYADTAFGYRHNQHVSLLDSLSVVFEPRLKFIPCDEEDPRPIEYIQLDIPNAIHFATFANTGFMETDRIRSQAESFRVFDTITGYTEHSIPEFIEKHKDFIRTNPIGYGSWIWKPKIIQHALSSMNQGDMLVYCDAGMYLNSHGLKRFQDYIELLLDPDVGILAFALNDEYSIRFAHPDAVQEYFPSFYDTKYRYCYGGVFIIKKTPETVELIEEWLSLCETYLQKLTMEHSHPDFAGSDGDNGLFNICLAKHDSIVKRVYPDETNIYFSEGNQFYGCPDWSSLQDFPFQCRRIRPVRIYT